MNKNKLLIIFLFSLLFFCFQCKEERVKPIKVNLDESNLPDNQVENAKIVFSDSGKVKAILKAGLIKVYNVTNETILDNGIVVDFFDRNEKHLSVLTADKGKVENIIGDLYAFGNVVVKSDDSVTLKTEELIWRENRKKIVTDKFVVITSPKETISGYGFESDSDLKNYVIFKVSGTFEEEKIR